MGASLGAKSIRRSDDMLADIEEFIAFINKDADYALAGESYGGYLARGLLARQKSKIAGLFLLCPLVYPGWRQGRVATKVVLEKDEAFLATLSSEERGGFDFLLIVQTKPTWEMYKADIRLGIMKGNEGFLDKQLDGAFSSAVDIAAVEYDRPTLVLLGRQDTEVGFEDQYDLYKSWKRATIQILDKAGHNLQIERGGIFSASFLDWLERIETDRA
jgi:pimeloyl-ACP methyl ester carboxylesterase